MRIQFLGFINRILEDNLSVLVPPPVVRLTLAVCTGALGSAQTDFSEQLKSLAGPALTLIVLDFPGYGLSRPPARSFGPDFYTEDARTAAALMEVRVRRTC